MLRKHQVNGGHTTQRDLLPPSSLALNTIHAIDCLEGLGRLPDGVVDIIVTSPPYNINKPYNHYKDCRPYEDYLAWMGEVASTSRRIIKDSGSFFLNIGSKPSDPWTPFDVAQCFRPHYHLQNVIHWIKSIAIEKADIGDYNLVQGDIAVGHYQPVNSSRYLSQCHEYIFHFTPLGKTHLTKEGVGVKYQDKSNIGRWKAATQDLRDRGNTWFIPYPTIRTSRSHPTTFPVKLPEMCIRLHGFTPRTLVLDPFMGTGSTAVACCKLGVQFIGFEIDPQYSGIAFKRLERLE